MNVRSRCTGVPCIKYGILDSRHGFSAKEKRGVKDGTVLWQCEWARVGVSGHECVMVFVFGHEVVCGTSNICITLKDKKKKAPPRLGFFVKHRDTAVGNGDRKECDRALGWHDGRCSTKISVS